MTEKTLPPLTAEDMQMPWDNGKTYPFVESEDCTIMGYGHPDRAEFAALVTEYDQAAGYGDEAPTTAEDVAQVWAVHLPVPNVGSEDEAGGWWMKWSDVTAETPNAFPVSIVQR